MRIMRILVVLMVSLFIFSGVSSAVDYTYRQSEIAPSVELGFQDYDVTTVSQDDSGFVEASLSLSGFNPETLRLVNTSSFDASIKLNDKEAFTLMAGGNMVIGFDSLVKVEIKCAEAGKTTVIEVSVWGRNDLDI